MAKMSTEIRKGVTVAVRAHAILWRDRTPEEHEVWLASSASQGMDCAGEPKLDSPDRTRSADGRTYVVVRARVRARRGWHMVPKCATLVDPDGIEWHAKKSDLAVVGF